MHYVCLHVADLQRSAAFYDALLGPLGWRRQSDTESTISWGLVKPVFFITSKASPQPGFGEVSFPGNSIPAIKAAWEAGTEHGGQSRDEPGSAPLYGPGNYAARVLDPDGHVVEICVAPE